MNYLKVSIGIFFVLAASRFVPHPPNFTSLLALSFYVPAFFGKKYIPALILSFALTDIFLGFHNTLFFTWGSVILIGYISSYFSHHTFKRIFGAITGVILFFIITNFGVWSSAGSLYDQNLNGLILCYTLALPFLLNSLISTIIFSLVIEGLLKVYYIKSLKINLLK